jgi:small conductance mechanosensitive channel
MIVVGAVLVGRFVSWIGNRITAGIDARSQGSDALVRSEAAKHRHAVTQVITWGSMVLIYCIAAVLALQRFNVPLTGFVAPATVAGVALGFGAQRIVQDILAGFFLIAERQYGFGDVIRLSVLGAPVAITGTVEEVTITPNGQIVQVINLSRDWARAVVDVPVPSTVDVNRVSEVLREVGRQAFADEALHPLMLDPPSVMGVESIEVDQFNVRVVARTLPGKQFDVGRALRARITIALLHEGITLPAGLEGADPTSAG